MLINGSRTAEREKKKTLVQCSSYIGSIELTQAKSGKNLLLSLKWTDLLLNTLKWQIWWVRRWHFYFVTFQNRAALLNIMLKGKVACADQEHIPPKEKMGPQSQCKEIESTCHRDLGLSECKIFHLNTFLLPTVSWSGRGLTHRLEQCEIQSCLVQGTWAWGTTSCCQSCKLSWRLLLARQLIPLTEGSAWHWLPAGYASGLILLLTCPAQCSLHLFYAVPWIIKNPSVFLCKITSSSC